MAAGNSETIQGTASAEVLNYLTIALREDMDFASVAAGNAAGTVVLNATTGACSSPSGLILSGTCQPAVIDGFGDQNQIVRIAVDNTITLTGSNGGQMTVTNLLVASSDLQHQGGNGNGLGNGNRRYRIQPASGLFTFNLGGTLNVGANQTPGEYTGTFTVTARYQ